MFLLAEDTKQALHLVKPSAMREVLVEVPNVRFKKIVKWDLTFKKCNLNLIRSAGQILGGRLI